MKAHALLDVGCNDHGKTVINSLRSDGALQLRQNGQEVYLVGAGATPVGGDELSLTIVVGQGAHLQMSSVAAMLAQPGVTNEPSRFTTAIRVEQNATLDWRPMPTISVRGSDHFNDVSIQLASEAELHLVEECRLGRWNEPSGVLTSTLRIEREGHVLIHHTNRFGDHELDWDGADGPLRHVTTTVRTVSTGDDTEVDYPAKFGAHSYASMVVNGLEVSLDLCRQTNQESVEAYLRESTEGPKTHVVTN